MSASNHALTQHDIIANDDYARQRDARRAALLRAKQRRRVMLGPNCTLDFENRETILFAIQERLLAGEGAQIADEVAAGNRLIPRGRDLVATVTIEADEAPPGDALTRRLSGVKDHVFLQIELTRVYGEPEGDIDGRSDGAASAHCVLRFSLDEDDDAAAFGDYGRPIMVGCDDPDYGHMAVLSEDARAEIAGDLG